jgi:hypothetical protein
MRVWMQLGPGWSEGTKDSVLDVYIAGLAECAFNNQPQQTTRISVMDVNGVDATNTASHPLKQGIYAPLPTFFLPGSEDLGLSVTYGF